MSAAESQWPAWLRRRTGVDFLGPPGRFFALLTIALSLGAILYVGAWNAAKYPLSLGYDAQPNAAYIHVLFDQHHIPRPDQSGEANQPPAYYFLAGIAARLGNEFTSWHDTATYPGFPEASYRGAQILNVVLVFLTALCVLWLARVVAPDRPWVWAASVGFFAFLPVVSKTEAMLHPENLNLLASALAVASATTILVRRRWSRQLVACLIVSCAVGLATRASMLFVLVTLALAVAIALGSGAMRRFARLRGAAIAAAVVAVVGLVFVSYNVIQHHHADPEASGKYFFHVTVREIFNRPWRPVVANEAFSQTYIEIWGDWFGAFSWSVFSGSPSPQAQQILKDQSLIGVVPTALALAGWLAIAWRALRHRRDLVVLALLPVVATSGYLIRSWLALTKDGDLFKASYLLNTAPVWAVCFGLATAWLASRSRLARYGMLVLFAAFAILELRFTLYGIRDQHPIF